MALSRPRRSIKLKEAPQRRQASLAAGMHLTSFHLHRLLWHRMEQGVIDLSYQAPVALLVTVVSLVLAYGWIWWRQRNLMLTYPRLELVVGNQGEFLEGLLRQLLWWCNWRGAPWQLLIYTDTSARVTLAILRHFFYPYPGNFFRIDSYTGKAVPAHILDLRQETSLNSAWVRLYQLRLKN